MVKRFHKYKKKKKVKGLVKQIPVNSPRLFWNKYLLIEINELNSLKTITHVTFKIFMNLNLLSIREYYPEFEKRFVINVLDRLARKSKAKQKAMLEMIYSDFPINTISKVNDASEVKKLLGHRIGDYCRQFNISFNTIKNNIPTIENLSFKITNQEIPILELLVQNDSDPITPLIKRPNKNKTKNSNILEIKNKKLIYTPIGGKVGWHRKDRRI
jgi:hypothetical protein